MGRGRARCAGNGVFVEEALVFCGRGIGVFFHFRGRGIGVFVIVALGFATSRGRFIGVFVQAHNTFPADR